MDFGLVSLLHYGYYLYFLRLSVFAIHGFFLISLLIFICVTLKQQSLSNLEIEYFQYCK